MFVRKSDLVKITKEIGEVVGDNKKDIEKLKVSNIGLWIGLTVVEIFILYKMLKSKG